MQVDIIISLKYKNKILIPFCLALGYEYPVGAMWQCTFKLKKKIRTLTTINQSAENWDQRNAR